MDEYVHAPTELKAYPPPNPDIVLVELPSGWWVYKRPDGTLSDAEYPDGVGALGAYVREVLKLTVAYQYHWFEEEGFTG